jgi:hypothetical protein
MPTDRQARKSALRGRRLAVEHIDRIARGRG